MTNDTIQKQGILKYSVLVNTIILILKLMEMCLLINNDNHVYFNAITCIDLL